MWSPTPLAATTSMMSFVCSRAAGSFGCCRAEQDAQLLLGPEQTPSRLVLLCVKVGELKRALKFLGRVREQPPDYGELGIHRHVRSQQGAKLAVLLGEGFEDLRRDLVLIPVQGPPQVVDGPSRPGLQAGT